MKKTHPFLLCFDSDGTVMDTMGVKHERCFGPAFLDVFGIDDPDGKILSHWLEVNLYRPTRGINRFQGLAEILEFLAARGMVVPGYQDFVAWTKSTPRFSQDLLALEAKKTNAPIFSLALSWSEEVNARIASLPPSKPFPSAKRIIPTLASADLVGVSSANAKAVLEEWGRVGLSPYFASIFAQEDGTKEQILRNALSLGYERALMLGDALGDYEAAKKAGIPFYPILPKKEDESWETFQKVAYSRFLAGEYDETPYVEAFFASLREP